MTSHLQRPPSRGVNQKSVPERSKVSNHCCYGLETYSCSETDFMGYCSTFSQKTTLTNCIQLQPMGKFARQYFGVYRLYVQIEPAATENLAREAREKFCVQSVPKCQSVEKCCMYAPASIITFSRHKQRYLSVICRQPQHIHLLTFDKLYKYMDI